MHTISFYFLTIVYFDYVTHKERQKIHGYDDNWSFESITEMRKKIFINIIKKNPKNHIYYNLFVFNHIDRQFELFSHQLGQINREAKRVIQTPGNVSCNKISYFIFYYYLISTFSVFNKYKNHTFPAHKCVK